MKLLTSPVALVIALLIAQSPARDARPSSATAGASVVRGRILSSAGLPLRNARVALTAEGHDPGWPVFTDGEGRFQFSGLTAARYTLTASKAGYVTTRFGARQPLEPPAPIVVGAGVVVQNVDVRLPKGAAISGRVVDEDGDPVVDGQVTAERLVRVGTSVRPIEIRSATTDDLGDYRLSELSPGSYLVVTDPGSSVSERRAVMALMRAGAQAGAVNFLRRGPTPSKLYYPSAVSPSQAQALPVEAGEELSSIDLTIRPVAMPHLSLTVADPAGTGATVQYELASESTRDDQLARRGSLQVGEHEVLPVVPGDWNLLVDGGDAGAAYGRVRMGETDAAIQIQLKPLVKISGRLVVDGRARSGDARLAVDVTPRGFPPRVASMFSHDARPNPDGTFTVEAVQGPIQIQLRNPPPGWRLQAIAVGGRRLPDTWIDVPSGSPIGDVTLDVSTEPTDLSGTVSDPSGQAVSSDSVLVFPNTDALLDNPDRWTRWIKPDPTGHFAIRDLPQGAFYVVAVADVNDALWQTAAYLDGLRSQATFVTLSDGRPTTVSLPVRGVR